MNRQQRIQWLARAFVGGVFLTAGAAWGVVYTWNGGAGNWDDLSKWTPGTAYPLAADTAVINSGTGTISLNGNQAVTGISINTGTSGAYTINNNTLLLGAAGIVQTSQGGNLTVGSNLTLAAGSVLSNDTGNWGNYKDVALNGTVDTAGYPLTIMAGGRNTYVNGKLTGAGNITVQRPPNAYDTGGVYFRSGTNDFSGSLTIDNNRATVDGGGIIAGASSILAKAGTFLSLGDTGTNVTDDGITTFGRVGNTTPIAVDTAQAQLIGTNGTATSETVGAVNLHSGRSTIIVTNGSGGTATFIPTTLTRNSESRAIAVVRSGNYTLGSSSFIKPADLGAGLTSVGGDGGRTTNKTVMVGFSSSTGDTYGGSTEGYSGNTLAHYGATNGLTPLANSDYVNATAYGVFPTVDLDGNDNVRLPYTVVHPVDAPSSMTVPAGTTVNSMVFYNDSTLVDDKMFTLNVGAGDTLTVKSGQILAGANPDGKRYYVTIAGGTLAFGSAEGVITAGRVHYGGLTINSNITGSNGLTMAASNSDDEGAINLNGNNSGLYGQISVQGGPNGISQVWVNNVYALGAGGNDLYLGANSLLRAHAAVTGSISTTVASLKGSGTVGKMWWSSGTMNIGGSGAGGANNTVTMLAGGAISPGTSGLAGTLTLNNFGTVALKDGTLALDLLGASSYDALSLTTGNPALTLSGGGNPGATLDLNLDYAASIGDLFLITKVGGATSISGTFSNGASLMTTYGGPNFEYNFDILYNSNLAGGDGNDIVLRLARIVIPEPASGIILSFALGALVLGRRRFS